MEQQEPFEVKLLTGERWWGGVANDGIAMPYGTDSVSVDMRTDLGGNQGAPLLVSNRGRSLWSSRPFKLIVANDQLQIWSAEEITLDHPGNTLREAYLYACQKFFPPSGTYPPRQFFEAPQYNTWIEMGYEPTESKVLQYAQAILDQGFPPGVLIIDDNWQEDYGNWTFHPTRFPDPSGLVKELHRLGFSVMVWVCPFVSPDSAIFRLLQRQGLLVSDRTGQPAIRSWWNGYSGVLDGSHPQGVQWFHDRVADLIERHGIDGVKMDAGDPEYYRDDDITYGHVTPTEQCRLWSLIGTQYRFNELRASWQMGGHSLIQRLRDRRHSWGEDGLRTLIPNGLAQGLLGYTFICPDMVGGGLEGDLRSAAFQLDEELFVRYAQCSALFPMMQFSLAPWRVLGAEALAICLDMVRLHGQIAHDVLTLAKGAATTGEPILRHLCYVFPDQGYEQITDQFLLGNEILVAPVLQPGRRSRSVVFPPGRWRGDDGSLVQGPTVQEVPAPLARLPWYRLQHP